MKLIDADKLKFYILDIESTTKNTTINKAVNNILHDAMIKIIDAQPTAYDVDKVIEELKTTRADYAGDFQDDVAYGLKLAIEIVKDGGLNEID